MDSGEYDALREQMRKQHAMNRNEVSGSVQRLDVSAYGRFDGNAAPSGLHAGFWFRIFLFLGCVMTCSFYIYGGQDVQKGAEMAWTEITQTVERLEREEPAIQEAMSYCKKGYRWVKRVVDVDEE